jgi:hypothetical protein
MAGGVVCEPPWSSRIQLGPVLALFDSSTTGDNWTDLVISVGRFWKIRSNLVVHVKTINTSAMLMMLTVRSLFMTNSWHHVPVKT